MLTTPLTTPVDYTTYPSSMTETTPVDYTITPITTKCRNEKEAYNENRIHRES